MNTVQKSTKIQKIEKYMKNTTTKKKLKFKNRRKNSKIQNSKIYAYKYTKMFKYKTDTKQIQMDKEKHTQKHIQKHTPKHIQKHLKIRTGRQLHTLKYTNTC